MQITLRPAVPADTELLSYWDTKPHVIASSGDDDWYDWPIELTRDVDWGIFLIAELEGRPIGIMEVIDPEREVTHYWGKVEPNLRAIDIWIGEEADLGKGYGKQMMLQALEMCFSEPDVKAVIIDPLASNLKARRFYERLCFKEVEHRKFGVDDCVVYRLERNDWLAS